MSNCQYIQALHNPFRLMGGNRILPRSFTNICRVHTLEADSVTMSPEDFHAKLADTAAQWNQSSPTPIARNCAYNSGNEVTVAMTESITASRVVLQDFWRTSATYR